MGLLTTLFMGFALAMDAFAVSITKGITLRKINTFISFKIAFFFGAFQAIMPLIGWLLGIKFSKNIDSSSQKNLLFIGKTGLGKTFIANSIANEVIKQGKSVIYQTAPNLMDMVMEYKFNFYGDDSIKENYRKIFEVDLLIIDDLGTETMTNNKLTELFNIINTRILNNKKIIISTNLTLNELYNNYDERVISRLIGDSIICKFIGDDIRLKKKKIKIQ